MNTDLVTYYARRVEEYERVYEKPERQGDIAFVTEYLKQTFAGKRILEVACGTGYWTQSIAQTARSVSATDIGSEVLQVAESKRYPRQNVKFNVADVYNLSTPKQLFDSGFGGFIWSHIPLERLPVFLESFHRSIGENGRVVFVDNCYIPGSSTPLAERDAEGNTYQLRKLQSGEEHRVLKNFPSESDLRSILERYASDIQIKQLTYFWILTYSVSNPKSER